jgi:hypothetical protein
MRPPGQGVRRAGQPGEAEVAALANHSAAQLPGVDAHGVVGRIADVRVLFPRCLDVGADPPFHSRSTGAWRIARTISRGVMTVASESMANRSRTCAVTGIAFVPRG